MNFIEERKYFDYELAYNIYKKVEELWNKGKFAELEKEFEIDYDLKDNGYIVVKDVLNGVYVYLSNRNFDKNEVADYYVSGEVDIIGYSGEEDNLYINDKYSIQQRVDMLLDYSKDNGYTIEDFESEMRSLEKVLEYLEK